MKSPNQRDRRDFALFCKQASDQQIINIYEKEKAANRRVYAGIAFTEMVRRNPLADIDHHWMEED